MDYNTRLNNILAKPGNKQCADCNGRNPRWASISLGVFVCIRCCGVHRSLGTHISKMKSTTLDKWTPQMFAIFEALDNEIANAYWEATMSNKQNKPVESSPAYSVEQFLRDKYDRKLWKSSGPDPVTQALQPRSEPKHVAKEEKRTISTGPIMHNLLEEPLPTQERPMALSFPQADLKPHHHHSVTPPALHVPVTTAHKEPNPHYFPAFQQAPLVQNPPFTGNYVQPVQPLNHSYSAGLAPPAYVQLGNAPQFPVYTHNPPNAYSEAEAQKNHKINQVLSMYGSQPAPANPQSAGFRPLGAIAAQNFFNQPSPSFPTF